MDGAHGRLARWRLRLSELDSLVETRAGAPHHAAETMSRLATPAVDTRPIPEEIPCLTLANSSREWTMPSYKDRRDYPPVTLDRLVQARAFQNPGFSAESGIYPDISGYIRWNLLAIQCESKTEDTARELTSCSGSSC